MLRFRLLDVPDLNLVQDEFRQLQAAPSYEWKPGPQAGPCRPGVFQLKGLPPMVLEAFARLARSYDSETRKTEGWVSTAVGDAMLRPDGTHAMECRVLVKPTLIWVPAGTAPDEGVLRSIEQQCMVREHGGAVAEFLPEASANQDSCMRIEGTRDAVGMAIERMLQLKLRRQFESSQARQAAVKQEGQARSAQVQSSVVVAEQPAQPQPQPALAQYHAPPRTLEREGRQQVQQQSPHEDGYGDAEEAAPSPPRPRSELGSGKGGAGSSSSSSRAATSGRNGSVEGGSSSRSSAPPPPPAQPAAEHAVQVGDRLCVMWKGGKRPGPNACGVRDVCKCKPGCTREKGEVTSVHRRLINLKTKLEIDDQAQVALYRGDARWREQWKEKVSCVGSHAAVEPAALLLLTLLLLTRLSRFFLPFLHPGASKNSL